MYACLHVEDFVGTGDAQLPGTYSVRRLIECASAFSPQIEATAPDTVVLDIHGLHRVFGPPAKIAGAMGTRAATLGFPAVRVAIAGNPDAAVCAARGCAGITVIPPGQEASSLASLPLDVLKPPPEMAEIFLRWGIYTLGEFAALPADGVAGRLGPAGAHLQRLARGAGDRPLVPITDPPVFEESEELDHPIELMEPLLFLFARMLSGICARLLVHGLAANEFRLVLKLAGGVEHVRLHRLPYPMRDSRAFLKVMQLDLEANPPGSAVVAVKLGATPTDPRVIQHGLFLPAAPEPDRLEVTLARLSKLTGAAEVGAAELLDTHRPDAFRMKRFSGRTDTGAKSPDRQERPYMALRVFRPPRSLTVHMFKNRPVRIESSNVRGRIVSLAGPWRSSGEWWRKDCWSRDEWDAGLDSGALYRIFRDRETGAWFLGGAYD